MIKLLTLMYMCEPVLFSFKSIVIVLSMLTVSSLEHRKYASLSGSETGMFACRRHLEMTN